MTYTSAHITPLNWPGTNLVDSGCNSNSGACPSGFQKVSQSTSSGCPRDCTTSACITRTGPQQNKTDCGVDPTSTGAVGKMCRTVPGLTATSFAYSQGIGGTYGSSGTGVKIKCAYTGTASDPFGQTTRDVFNGEADLRTMQQNYCNSLTSPTALLAQENNCTAALGATAYKDRLMNMFMADTNFSWKADKSPGGQIAWLKTQALQATDPDANAIVLFQMFCRGGDGENPKGMGLGRTTNNPLCACMNAQDFGFVGDNNCFTSDANKALLGCASFTLNNQPVQGIVELFSGVIAQGVEINQIKTTTSVGNNAGIICSACSGTRAYGIADTTSLPYTNISPVGSINMQICNQTVTIGAAQNSPISLTCDQSIVTGGDSSQEESSGSPSGSPSDDETPSSDSSDNTILWGGGLLVILMCFFLLMAVALMGGENGKMPGNIPS